MHHRGAPRGGLKEDPWGCLEEEGWRGVSGQVGDQHGGCCKELRRDEAEAD